MSAAPANREPLALHRAAADAVQIAAYRRMTPGRRLELAMAMQRDARALMDAGLRLSHPNLTPAERRREIARRWLYAAIGES